MTCQCLSFFFFKFFFNWRKIALQCCVGFCNTTKQTSHNYHFPLESPSPPPSHPSRSSQSTRLGSLCHIATSHQLSILHTVVYICWRYFLHSSHSFLSLLCPQVHSLYLRLHSFPASRFINTICFRFHIYALIYYICFSLSDLLHSVQQVLGSSTSLELTQINSFNAQVIVYCKS